ncbi:hypothetical protein TcG_05534 [Trypanosoma cruzi]|uniref:PCIF1 WW domain-containing protein n=2 Tax=Trypanosoma cruzi TaxID=5693 RepID=V5BAG8_TRYCR|nr:hypothetical protein TCDM_07250 [Trypanosoma cruzi Dm28c]KAF8287179.1 putative Phosphorylated CTD interacting factor 1 WW domain containing protein [Trypanosoma cruzi]PBJ78168.1 hypothetical protein BCY84_05036 [Trypanosoma cruzi cruzi]PWU93295.1 hypothetical protein C4B63_32g242 [Trypanosoma cruzi]RNF17383.1 hypothetical protein TcG_05534 [Trypanosoma cruzi]
MKRKCVDGTLDAAHPGLCFHREVLTYLRWSAIRRDFLEALQASPHLRFTEPKKLWRHSQEALGKWVLSQLARDTRGDRDAASSVSFFPTRAMLSSGTYDEQLIRDVSLKCGSSGTPTVVAEIKQLIASFNLSKRCEDAAAEVLQELESASPSIYCTPSLRIIDAAEVENRTGSQRRVHGAIAEISVRQPKHVRRGCPPVSIPLAAYKKLEMCYKHFAEKTDGERYPRLDYGNRFLLRAATIALRYEGCLATGSLQLCADISLKRHLHAAGYHVMDLCASPINAYMGSPKTGSYNNNEDSSLEGEKVPNHFCSAFPDTDCYFGSLGSALKFDVEAAYNSSVVNPEKKPLLLTLDVPYDEDLCERLFSKLVNDMQQAASKMMIANEKQLPPPFVVDYVLVLPLWWDLPMERKKLLFTTSGGPPLSSDEEEASMDAIVKERSAVLSNGYTVPYEWPQRLAKTAGKSWVCFDGIFVGDTYNYFCTITNKCIPGVTATEVIGLAQPRATADGGQLLETLFASFYGTQQA